MIKRLCLALLLFSIVSEAGAISIEYQLEANADASGTGLTSSSFDSTGFEYIVVIYKHEEGTVGITFEDNKSSVFSELTYVINGTDVGAQIAWAEIGTPGTGHTVTVTAATAREFRSFAVYLIDSSGEVFLDEEASATGSGTAVDAGTLDNDFAGVSVMGVGHFNSANWTESSGWTQDSSDGINRFWASRADVTPTTVNPAVTASFDTTWAAVGASFYEVTAEYDQEGFSFGDDDNNEASHTLDTQDTNHTGAVGVKTLRTLVNITGTGSSITPSLRFQKNGSGGYAVVATAGTTAGQTGAIEVGDATDSGNNTASAFWAIGTPAMSTGDLMLINLAWDDSTTTTDVAMSQGHNNETPSVILGPITHSGGTDFRAKCWSIVATGNWEAGAIIATPTATEQWTATVIRIPAGEFDATTPVSVTGSSVSAGANVEPWLAALQEGASDGGGRPVQWVVADTNDPDGSVTGWTTISSVDRGVIGANLEARDTTTTDNETIAAASGLTIPAARQWVTIGYIVRPPADVTNEVYISASANVTAGGEATTARLTAPSGKTTADFDTGRRWDDENGSDAVAIGDDEYTEYEWVLTTQSPATTDDYFDFRTYVAGAALDTYSVTPRWTIGTGGAPAATPFKRRHNTWIRR